MRDEDNMNGEGTDVCKDEMPQIAHDRKQPESNGPYVVLRSRIIGFSVGVAIFPLLRHYQGKR